MFLYGDFYYEKGWKFLVVESDVLGTCLVVLEFFQTLLEINNYDP